VEPDEDGVEMPGEECFLYPDENEEPDLAFQQQMENHGPPQLSNDEIAQLDQASLEELVRLSNLVPNGDEMILDTRLVFDWRFREQQWRTRARWGAREFRSGDASNEQTFSPMSSKWITHVLLVLALVQQLSSMLVTDVQDAFLTVPQRDFVLVGIPAWAKTDEMGMATACIKTRSNVCTSQFT